MRRAKVVVTGAAGFIGSHLVDELLRSGHRVVGLDDFDPWYDPEAKRRNLVAATASPDFELRVGPVSTAVLDQVLPGTVAVFHLAGRPGVQTSWGDGFGNCARRNIELTQVVLDATLREGTPAVVVASSSSVYGSASGCTEPSSPYGISKLAVEHLARVYGDAGVPITTLRYFTVYGPRQRPDMALHRLFEAARPGGRPFRRRGDGRQRRQLTYVADVVDATIAAWRCGPCGETFDVGGCGTATLNELIAEVTSMTGRPIELVTAPAAPGDPDRTVADLETTRRALGWSPTWSLQEGLAEQHRWHAQRSANVVASSSTLAG